MFPLYSLLFLSPIASLVIKSSCFSSSLQSRAWRCAPDTAWGLSSATLNVSSNAQPLSSAVWIQSKRFRNCPRPKLWHASNVPSVTLSSCSKSPQCVNVRYKRDLVTLFASFHHEAWGNTTRSCAIEFREEKSELEKKINLEIPGLHKLSVLSKCGGKLGLPSQPRPYQKLSQS